MADLIPLWKTPTQAQAKNILILSRARTLGLVGDLEGPNLTRVTQLGGGAWSVKDLLGHLAAYEEQALSVGTLRKPPLDFARFGTVDERNAADIERKRSWSVQRVRQDLDTTRSELLQAIDDMDEDRWMTKIFAGGGRSALALVLGRLLVGGRHGLYAHDFAHVRDLEKSVDRLRRSNGG